MSQTNSADSIARGIGGNRLYIFASIRASSISLMYFAASLIGLEGIFAVVAAGANPTKRLTRSVKYSGMSDAPRKN